MWKRFILFFFCSVTACSSEFEEKEYEEEPIEVYVDSSELLNEVCSDLFRKVCFQKSASQ